MLFREFDQIFHDIFTRRAPTYREIAQALVNGPRTVSQIGNALEQGRGGGLNDALHALTLAGFVRRDTSFDLDTGNARPRAIRYRLRDNYLRFYLFRSSTIRGAASWANGPSIRRRSPPWARYRSSWSPTAGAIPTP